MEKGQVDKGGLVQKVLSEGLELEVLPKGQEVLVSSAVEVEGVWREVRKMRGKALVIMERLLDKALEWDELERTDKVAVVAVIKMLFGMVVVGKEEGEVGYEEFVHRIRREIKEEGGE